MRRVERALYGISESISELKYHVVQKLTHTGISHWPQQQSTTSDLQCSATTCNPELSSLSTPSPDSDLEVARNNEAILLRRSSDYQYQSALLASRTIQTVPLLASAVSLVSTNTLPPADTGGTRHVSIDGQELTFNASSVPDPPKGLRYSGDKLDSLFSDWYRSDHVKIEGVGIPIQHWPLIYSTRAGFKKNAWTVHRSTWHNWKYIMEEYESLGSNRTAFWTKHINTDGTRMSYNQILDSLKADRKRVVKAKDAPLAAQAKMFFNGDLTAASARGRFLFRKGGIQRVCTSDKEISKRWSKLLEDDEDIRRTWEAVSPKTPGADSDFPLASSSDELTSPGIVLGHLD